VHKRVLAGAYDSEASAPIGFGLPTENILDRSTKPLKPRLIDRESRSNLSGVLAEAIELIEDKASV